MEKLGSDKVTASSAWEPWLPHAEEWGMRAPPPPAEGSCRCLAACGQEASGIPAQFHRKRLEREFPTKSDAGQHLAGRTEEISEMQCAFVWLEMLNVRPHRLIWRVGNHGAEPLKTKHKRNTTSCIFYPNTDL